MKNNHPCSLESIKDLTAGFLEDVLRDKWNLPNNFQRVSSVSIERVDQGILSCVYRASVTYDFDNDDDDDDYQQEDHSIPMEWIVKLPRDDLRLEWMFRVEKIFYETVAPMVQQAGLPFTVPRMLLATKQCLILEGIQDITCHPLTEGVPAEKMDFVTHALASLHAFSWKSRIFQAKLLALNNSPEAPPGMGQRLSPLQKEYLFTRQWRDAVEAIQIQDASMKEFILDLCQQMECRRLRDIHNLVHTERLACVHGDFHIANFLFPNNDKTLQSSQSPIHDRPFLIDWAAFGYGNPMTDVAFFLVLSDIAATNVMAWLEQYHKNLVKCNPNVRDVFSFELMLQKFRWAMLYQWMILVAYDKMSRQLAQGDNDDDLQKVEVKLKHFANVNRRAVLALYGVRGFELDKIPLATDNEQKEARDYSREKPLTI